MMQFTHLHIYSEYSISKGMIDIRKMILRAKELGMKAIALTDFENLHAVKEFYEIANKHNIKPIIGCELKVDFNNKISNNFILLAKNKTGYKNLMKLVSKSYLKTGTFKNPAIDFELLLQFHSGLICLLPAQIYERITFGDFNLSKILKLFRVAFYEDFYIEIVRHYFQDTIVDKKQFIRQEATINSVINFSKNNGIKLVATNNVYFLHPDDVSTYERFACIKANLPLSVRNKLKISREAYLKSGKEMAKMFTDFPEAIENTMEIARKIESFSIEIMPKIPGFCFTGLFSCSETLKNMAFEGAEIKYGKLTNTIKNRINFELEVINKLGAVLYFLKTNTIIKAAKKMNILIGPGRGTITGSIVAYCLDFTKIDPLKNDLLFERFININWKTLPIIAFDFEQGGREKMIQYLKERYGKKYFAEVVTFNRLGTIESVRLVGKLLGAKKQEINDLVKIIHRFPRTTLKSALLTDKRLKEKWTNGNNQEKMILKYAQEVEGKILGSNIHSCSLVLENEPLIDYIPLMLQGTSDCLVSQFTHSQVNEQGLMVFDFMELKALTLIKKIIEKIKEKKNISVDIDSISLNDKKTLTLFCKGNTKDIFQFGSSGMQETLQQWQPSVFEDLIVLNALYRPITISLISSVIHRKHGEEPITYEFSAMKAILKSTYGIIIFQEQVILLSQLLASFSKPKSNTLCLAIEKMEMAEIKKLEKDFILGCINNGYDKVKSTKVWKKIISFPTFYFNKSHSFPYALIAYQTGYLKANFPREFKMVMKKYFSWNLKRFL